MQRLYSAILARNEAGPLFRRVLQRLASFSQVLLLDDRSTDQTPKIAKEYGAIVRRRAKGKSAWGEESSARKELWDFALGHCTSPNDWVLICDADMELVGDPRDLIQTKECNSVAFILYDLWSETEYRADEYWRGHEFPRIWLVAPRRVPDGWEPVWSPRGIHVGHLPANWPQVPLLAPPDAYYWLHHAYSTPERRQQKFLKYQSQFGQMSPHEIAHARSILA